METTCFAGPDAGCAGAPGAAPAGITAQYHKPLICFTMNIRGPVKDSPLIRRGFARGRQLLRQQFLRAKLVPPGGRTPSGRSRPECSVLDANPLTIKKFTTDIEDATPLGRLSGYGRHPPGWAEGGPGGAVFGGAAA